MFYCLPGVRRPGVSEGRQRGLQPGVRHGHREELGGGGRARAHQPEPGGGGMAVQVSITNAIIKFYLLAGLT